MGRFLRFYPAYTAEAVLAMPASRFWALFRVIARLEAAESLQALTVAFYAAHPGERGRALQEYQAELSAKVSGQREVAVGLPSAALSGPMVSDVASNVIRGRLERAAQQVAEQERAWQTGGWPALIETLAQQQQTNRSSV